MRNLLRVLLLITGISYQVGAQVTCPPNLDLEMGNFTNWTFYTGTCCGAGDVVTIGGAPVAAVACRHTLVNSATGSAGCTATPTGPFDEYGGFPVVPPGTGTYAMRLGNKNTGREAERALYYIHVPTSTSNYSLVYRYAVVFQDPGHTTGQPRFEVEVFDSATLTPVPCAQYTYVAGGTLPGFMASTCTTCAPNPSASTPIFYKDWTTSSIDLSGYGGTTVGVRFTSADCSAGGHFGYGYLDLSCGLFEVTANRCDTLTPPTLTAPPGFATYTWYDSSTFTTIYGTTQSITISYPPSPVTLAVVLGPWAGFGCPDTLYTRIIPAHMELHPSNDTSICSGECVPLNTNATDVATPLTYSWTPTTGLSCTTCANPTACPTTTTAYTVTVTNTADCQQTHVFNVTVRPGVSTTVAYDTPTCYNYNNGWASVSSSSGSGPYSYSWSTVPTQTTSMATGLSTGTYSVVVTNAYGCTDTNSVYLLNPAPRTISLVAQNNPTTCLGVDGSLVFTGSIITDTVYTISYKLNGIPQTVVVTANALPQVTINGLSAGVYSDITIVGALCPYNTIGAFTLSDPPNPDLSGVTSNSFVCVGDTLKLFASSSTTGITWRWEGPAGFVSLSQNPMIYPVTLANAGTYSVTVQKNNCYNNSSTIVDVRPLPEPTANSNTPVCSGDTLFLSSSSANGATSYLWSGPNFFSSVDQNPYIAHVQTVSTGVYTVAVTKNGCTVPVIINVVVNQTPGAPIGPDTNYCQYDQSIPFYVTGDNLLWYTTADGGTGISTAPTPSTAKGGGTETWWVTQTSAEGCVSDRGKVSARIWTMPYPDLSLTDKVSCIGKYMTFTVGNTGEGADGITWYFEPGDSVRNVNPVYHAFNKVGLYNVYVNTYYKYCRDTALKIDVSISPYASFDLGSDTSICAGSMAIELSPKKLAAYGGNVTWKWNTGETTPKIKIVSPGVYFAKANLNGCETIDSITVVKDCYIDIPNVFTPNGDGVNDFFFPRQMLSKGLTDFRISIYNRWGQTIFEGNALDGRGWDGNLNGVPQPEGVYVYIIEAVFRDGQKESHKGNVTLLR